MTDPVHMYLEQLRHLRREMGSYPKDSIYEGLPGFVLTHGVDMVSTEWTEDDQAFLESITPRGPKHYEIRQCFYNAQILSTQDHSGRLTYYEGYATAGVLPVLHGWCVLDGTKVIDLTWRLDHDDPDDGWSNRILGTIPEGWHYVGVPFAQERVISRILETGEARTVLDDWERGYPILKEPYKVPKTPEAVC